MKFLKKITKFIGYAFIIAFVSIGLGINGVIFPVYKREEDNGDKIEMVEHKDRNPDDQTD